MKHVLLVKSSLFAVASLVTLAVFRAQRDTAHAALQDRAAALQAKVARLEHRALELEREKDEFLATLSHELRSPLNAILGWIELLRVHLKDPPQQLHAIDVIERNARAEVRIIADLLDMARLVTHRLHLTREAVSLEGVVREAAGAIGEAAAAKSIALHIESPDAVHVVGDRARLRQVVTQLLANAVKFTPSGGSIRVNLGRDASGAIIQVTDTGIGLSRDMLTRVFERFRQAESGLTRSYGGLGLGLAIARHLVELHGGTVEAASRGLQQGATFTVRLPQGADPLAPSS